MDCLWIAIPIFKHPRPKPWSQLDKAGYLAFQEALRSTYVECPMDVEFMLWRGTGQPIHNG